MDQSDCPQDDTDNRERTGYFTGQVLSADDFRREQDYHRAALRRHNRALHGWGVVSGLEVTPSTSAGSEVVVHPGYALDPSGREVIVTEPVTLTVAVGNECFVAVRAADARVRDGIVRDDVEVAVVSVQCPGWIMLASIQSRSGQLALDPNIRRPLRCD